MSRRDFRTLVVGGSYVDIDGVAYVNERWLRMVEIFTSNIAKPLFALRLERSTDRLEFSTPFSYDVIPVNPPSKSQPWEVANPFVDWNRKWHIDLVDKVDAVYCRFPSCYWEGYHIYRLASAKGKTTFASFHGDWAGVYEHLADNSSIVKRFLYSVASVMAHRKLAEIAQMSRVLFCVGKELERSYSNKSQVSVVFANYLHEKRDIYYREDTCREKPFRIIYVGSLTNRKGVNHLFNVVGKLRSHRVPVVLSVVGEGEDKSSLAALAEQLNIKEYIEWHGYIPFGADLYDKYRESDLFVLPSLAGEGMPKVVVEAMSQGLPVVVSDIGSTRQIIQDSGAGLLVPPGDEDRLYDALTMLIQNSELRKNYIHNGLEFASHMTNNRQRKIIADAFVEHLSQVMPVKSIPKLLSA